MINFEKYFFRSIERWTLVIIMALRRSSVLSSLFLNESLSRGREIIEPSNGVHEYSCTWVLVSNTLLKSQASPAFD